MLNYIWIFMMIISFISAALTGRMDQTLQAFLDSGKKTFDFVLSVGGIMAMWSGIMAIAERSRLTERISSLMSPLISFLFTNVSKNSPAAKAISMNMVANFLGLANAATPLGIEAMKELNKLNKSKIASRDMCMFAVINSASIQLIPSTLIALRFSLGSLNPGEIILPIWIASVITAASGVIGVKISDRKNKL